MLRKVIPAQVRMLGEDEVEIIMSTASLARDGHILVPQGAVLENYRSNPIQLYQHDPDLPVGTNEEIVVSPDKITARSRFAPMGVSAKADEVRGLVKAGIIRTVSVGFDPIECEPLDPKKPRGGQRILRWELLECSWVTIPADVGAIVTARTIGDRVKARLLQGAAIPGAATARARGETKTNKEKNHMAVETGERSVRAVARRALRNVTSPRLTRGLYDVAQFAYMLEQLGYIKACAEWEKVCEADDSEVPAMIGEALMAAGKAFVAMAEEECAELMENTGVEEDDDGEDVVVTVEERGHLSKRAIAWRRGIAAMKARKKDKGDEQAEDTVPNGEALAEAGQHLDRAVKRHRDLGKSNADANTAMDGARAAHTDAKAAHGKLGDALKDADTDDADDAKNAVERCRALHGEVGDALAEMGTQHQSAGHHADDAADTHKALGRSIKSAQGCMREVPGVGDKTKDGDSDTVQTSSGDENEGARSADFRRRQADKLALITH